MESLSLQHLEQRRKSRRISLLLYILANEEHYPALSSAYEDENKYPKWIQYQIATKHQLIIIVNYRTRTVLPE